MSLTADASRLWGAAEGARRGGGGALLLEEVVILTATAEDGTRKREAEAARAARRSVSRLRGRMGRVGVGFVRRGARPQSGQGRCHGGPTRPPAGAFAVASEGQMTVRLEQGTRRFVPHAGCHAARDWSGPYFCFSARVC